MSLDVHVNDKAMLSAMNHYVLVGFMYTFREVKPSKAYHCHSQKVECTHAKKFVLVDDGLSMILYPIILDYHSIFQHHLFFMSVQHIYTQFFYPFELSDPNCNVTTNLWDVKRLN